MVCVIGTLDPRPTGRMKLQLEGLFRLKERPGPGMCCVWGCREKHAPERKGGKLYLCGGHLQQRWRQQSPKQAAFDTLRTHARQRRIAFTLTFARFTEITDAADYWQQNASTHGDKLSVDRIDMAAGYSDDNVRIITVSENVRLGNVHRHLSPVVQAILARRDAAPKWQMSGAQEGEEFGLGEEPF